VSKRACFEAKSHKLASKWLVDIEVKRAKFKAKRAIFGDF